ncbi:10889_t:CDS:1, partial [Funneliformis caledonium]
MSNEYLTWIEKSIAKEYLNYYKYSDFKKIQPIGSGNFGNVYRINWKDTDSIFALKLLDDNKLMVKEIVNE